MKQSITWLSCSKCIFLSTHLQFYALIYLTQCSAGVRDSALTIHGRLQADRLGQYFAQAGLKFTQIFSSDLQRAYKTAEAVALAQGGDEKKKTLNKLDVSRLRVLREQDFGFYEGKPFYTRERNSQNLGKDIHRSHHSADPGFQDVESKESMVLRMDDFIRDHLLHLLCNEKSQDDLVVAVISHGIILSHLWRCLLKLLPRNSVALAPGLLLERKGTTILENIGAWSNTGYLELNMERVSTDTLAADTFQSMVESQSKDPLLGAMALKMVIKTVNGKDHLKSLKRTRGGVGSSKYDEGQKKIDAFFKKPKIG